jgi:HSP20 family protein
MAKKEKKRSQLAPSRPFSEISRWEPELERMFDDFFGRRLRPLWPGRWGPVREVGLSIPPVDLYEEKDEIVVKAELPGMSKEDIQINITDHLLTIKGEKKKEEEIKEADYYRSERSYGSFSRSVDLPGEVQIEKAQASFKNGVLEIRLPRTEEAKRREIKVKVE